MTPLPTRHSRMEVRRRIASVLDGILADLPVEYPFDLNQFCAALAQRRGRDICLVAMSPLLAGEPPPEFSGLWLGGSDVDYLFYDDTTSRLHWQNSVLHEIAHMLMNHRAPADPEDAHLWLLRLMLPDLSPEMLRRTVGVGLCRSRYAEAEDGFTATQEHEAELLGTEMWKRWSDASGAEQDFQPLDAADTEVICRLVDGLGVPRDEPRRRTRP